LQALFLSDFTIKSFFSLQFFEMPRHEAIKALDIYKRAGQQVMLSIDFAECQFVVKYSLSTPKVFIGISFML
jgi:hypothetical protein